MRAAHLFPPNLLKLFAPWPPLSYTGLLERDIDCIRLTNVEDVGYYLQILREGKTQHIVNFVEGEGVEEREEPTYTHAEET